VIRRADLEDVYALFELEKAASSTGLAHVFGPDLPFPDDDVLARWSIVLDDPDVTVLLDEEGGEPIGYAAYDSAPNDTAWLRHFGLLPAWWGSGRADLLHHAVLSGLAAAGAVTAYLWVLVDNHRAKAFYQRRGWRATGMRETEVFPPYPVKMQMALDLVAEPDARAVPRS
jgi:GNAT superfamily N-acetyltransferase